MATLIRAAATCLLVAACVSPSTSELAFDRAVCVEFDLETSRCEAIVAAAATVVPEAGALDGVGMWPPDKCAIPPCPTARPDLVAIVTFHYVDDRPSVVVQVRSDASGNLKPTLMTSAYAEALGVP